MKILRLGIIGKILALVTTVFVAGVAVLLLYASRATERNVIEASVANARSTIAQYKTLRAYYTEHVVKKVKAGTALKVSFDHRANTNTVPLPATMIHDLSEEFAKQTNGLRLRLYSAYPFPNRKDRVLDPFMREALAYFSTNTSGAVVRTFSEQGHRGVRVAIADEMVSASCVACHNAHPDSPKKDWKLGDVRGVLEVESPINAQLANNQAMIGKMAGITVGVVALLVALVVWGITRWIARPVLGSVRTLHETGGQMTAALGQVTTASRWLADGASQQAASLEETSSTLEEISSMTERNASNARTAKDLANQTRVAADHGANDMREMSAAMTQIKTASDEVAKIIKTIDEIAFQTNILALNAAVEAARAGEAGMGFAVVADEVRNLAQRSARAAQETAEKIEDSIRKSEHGVQMSGKAAHSLQEMVSKARKVDELVAEIAAASQEQSQSIRAVNVAVAQVDKVTQSNAACAEQSAGAADELTAQAALLKETADHLLKLLGAEASSAASNAGRAMRPSRAAHAVEAAPVIPFPTAKPKPAPAPSTSRKRIPMPPPSQKEFLPSDGSSFIDFSPVPPARQGQVPVDF